MRILHTSDWHLGAMLGGTSLLDSQEDIIRQLLECCDSQNIDAVIIAGDVYDHAVSNPDSIRLYNYAMTELCAKRGLSVFVCAGNHDGAARLASCSELLKEAGLFVAGSIRDGIKFVDMEDARIHLLPYFSADEVRYLHPEEEINGYNDSMRTILNDVRRNISGERRNILAAHCYVSGAEVSESDRSVMVGGANAVDKTLFEGFDYVALGHLHKPQNMEAKIRYSGAPVKLSFSEEKAVKSFTILDTKKLEQREYPVRQMHELRTIRGSYREIMEYAEKDAKRDDYVRIILKDEYAHLELLHALRGYYPNLLALEGKEYEQSEEHAVLSVADIKKLTAKEIMCSFMLAYTGEEPEEELVNWFLDAEKQAGGDA